MNNDSYFVSDCLQLFVGHITSCRSDMVCRSVSAALKKLSIQQRAVLEEHLVFPRQYCRRFCTLRKGSRSVFM